MMKKTGKNTGERPVKPRKSGLLKNLAIAGLASLLSFAPLKASAQMTYEKAMDPFHRPNSVSQNYYGSGDVNNDGVVNYSDLDAIDSGVKNDYSDIDGDGEPSTPIDRHTLNRYLEGNLKYLPGDWDNLETKQEKESWVEKCLAIDETSKKDWIKDKWMCDDFATQIDINFNGYEKEVFSSTKYDFSNNCRFNIPVYTVGTINRDGVGHRINAILTGEDPKNINDYHLFDDSQLGTHVNPFDSWSVDPNSALVFETYYEKNGDGNAYVVNPIAFNLFGDYAQAWFIHRDFLTQTTKPMNVEAEKPLEFILKQNSPNPFNGSTTLNYELKEPGNVVFEVFNLAGQKIETLVNSYQPAGNYNIPFNFGSDAASGTYLYRLSVDKESTSGKMMYTK